MIRKNNILLRYSVLIFLSLLILGCTKNKDSFLSKGLQSPSPSPSKQNNDSSKVKTPQSGIYNVQVSGFFQRGLKFAKGSAFSVLLQPTGYLSSVFITNEEVSLSIPIKQTLTASLNKTGPGGLLAPLKKGIPLGRQGAYLYLIAKESGLDPALVLIPVGSALKLPKSYQFYTPDPLWYVFIHENNQGQLTVGNFIDLGNGINHYYHNGTYSPKHKISLNHFSNLKEIKGIFSKAPPFARYVLLDVTLVLKNQSQRGFFDIISDRGAKKFLVERLLFSPTKEERIYRKTITVPLEKKSGAKGLAIIKARITGLSSTSTRDAHAYIYVKGWKKVSHF